MNGYSEVCNVVEQMFTSHESFCACVLSKRERRNTIHMGTLPEAVSLDNADFANAPWVQALSQSVTFRAATSLDWQIVIHTDKSQFA